MSNMYKENISQSKKNVFYNKSIKRTKEKLFFFNYFYKRSIRLSRIRVSALHYTPSNYAVKVQFDCN